MTDTETAFQLPPHDHMFLGKDHDRAERRTWTVIILCSVMMIVEIIGGALFGSLALIADGLHMSTHAGALLLAALAYTYARKYANDRNFTFGTGKFGDLAGYSSAIVLAMIALLIGYEAVSRLFNPVPISFNEAIPIAALGLVVNVASAWLLSGGHHHNHGHDHDHDHGKKPARIDSSTDAFDVELEEHDHDAGHSCGRGVDRLWPVEHGVAGEQGGERAERSRGRRLPADPDVYGPEGCGRGAEAGSDRRLEEVLARDGRRLLRRRLLLRPRASQEDRPSHRNHPHLLGRHAGRSVDKSRGAGGGSGAQNHPPALRQRCRRVPPVQGHVRRDGESLADRGR